MILERRMSLEDIIENGNQYFPDMVKFCIDRKRRVVSIDEEMHIDMENELYDDGSGPDDIYGGDIMIDSSSPLKTHLLWEAHPNIERNRQLGIGHGRTITDQNTIDDLYDILTEWVC